MANADDPELHCLVLAAGPGERFGAPKQLLAIDGEALLHRTCRQALTACPRVTVVLGARAPALSKVVDDLPLVRIDNPDWREGLASSLRAGVLALPATADGVLILLADQPAVTADHLRSLVETWQRQPATVAAAAYDGAAGVPVIWPRDWFGKLVTLSGDHGARDLLATAPLSTVDMPAAACDIDTPADLDRLREQLDADIAMPAATE